MNHKTHFHRVDFLSGRAWQKLEDYYLLNYLLLHLFFLHFRSDEDDPSGAKYRRMEDDNMQDKERFAR